MSRSRSKGTAAETAVVDYLRKNGFPEAERRALHGNRDKGDITGIHHVCIEVKATTTTSFGAWLVEVEAERVNSCADIGVVVHKPRGAGLARIADWHVVMALSTFARLINDPPPSAGGAERRQ